MTIPANAGDLMPILSKEIILTALPVLVQGHKKHDFFLESHLGVLAPYGQEVMKSLFTGVLIL